MVIVIRFLVTVATAYLASIGLLWGFQSNFLYPAPQEAAPLTPGYEEVALRTSDGLALRAFYHEAEQGLPTIVYFPGNGGTLSGASVSNGALMEAGVGVLLVEYRGYGGNPGEPSEEGFYRDGEAAIAWLKARGIKAQDLIIVANSIGGGVATEMAVRHDPAALILIAPFTSLPDAAQDNLWWMPASLLVRDQYRNADKVSELDMPVLVQHGDADTLIPDQHGERLARRAPNAEFQSFEGSGHALSFERRSQEARRDWILALSSAD